MSYYNHHDGTLFPGKIARSEDIHRIQFNVADAIASAIKDQYDNTSFILGSRENDFLISPAPKRLGRYIDNMNLVNDTNEIWLDIDSFGYKQAIKTSKSSLYSVIVKLRNLYSTSQDVSFELWSEESKIAKQTISVPANTQSSEFEVVFNLEHFSTMHGRNGEDLERADAEFVMHPNMPLDWREYSKPNNPDNQSIGATCLYLVVKAIHKATEIINPTENDILIDENTFMICADAQGNYGQLLERTADDGRNYESTDYDLFFKSVYSNAPTYLCTGGAAVVDGEPVMCHDTHVTVDGASSFGDTKSYIVMDSYGQLKSYTSQAYMGDESNAVFDEFPINDLIIAIIYTYNGDIKQPKIVQDDTLVEDLLKKDKDGEHEFGLPIRQRSHHERLRRLEKEMAYQRDITIPSRLKYNLTGDDIPDTESKADEGGIKTTQSNLDDANPQLVLSDNQKAMDLSDYFISTDRFGNFVVKSVNGDVEHIPVTLKESETTDGKTPIQLAQTIVSSEHVDIDRQDGIVDLSEYTKKVDKNNDNKKASTISKYGVGTTAKEAKLTELNPWDDRKGNRPETVDIKPTTRAFTTKKGVNGVHVRSSEYPAMTMYLPEKITLKELALPVTKFKNVDKVQFHIFERQGPNNKHNTVWLEKYVKGSPKYSLKNAKTKNGYQILDKPFVWEIKEGLKLRKHQYIILVQIFPKSGEGTVYIETYKPKDSTDFLIRYHGSADCAHFRLKTRYREIWYTSADENKTDSKKKATIKAEVNETYKEGRIESGEVVWENSEPINSIQADMNAHTPDGCSIELQANAGNGWKTLKNHEPVKITGGTSSFRWRAILKGNGKRSPTIFYDDDDKYAINFTITKNKPKVGAGLGDNRIEEDKNVLTTQTFYPGDILQKYIGDSNLNTCDKFSNYEWLRVFASNEGDTKAVIDIAASDMRIGMKYDSINNKFITDNNSVIYHNACSSKRSEYDIDYDVFTTYYADLTLDDFVQESVDYSNYDNNIEYDEHNLRFKIETDKAYNDDDVAILSLQNVDTRVDDYDPSKETQENDNIVDTNPTITVNTNNNYLTVFFNDFTPDADNLPEDNRFIWKYTLPGNSTLDLSKYSALKFGYQYLSNNDNQESSLKGLALYISSAVEQEAPSNNYDAYDEDNDGITYDGKKIRKYDELAPDTLEASELEEYKDSILEVTRTINNITYTEYYYYVPNNEGIWVKHQLHNIKSYTLYELPLLQSAETTVNTDKNHFTISIDKDNDNFKYVKEIGLVALGDNTDVDHNLNSTGRSSLQFFDIKGIIQGYNAIYAAEQSLTPNTTYNEHCKTALFKDATGQISSITRVYYNRLVPQGEMLAFVNNNSFTTDANHVAINFVADTYLPKDSLIVNLCAEKNGVKPVFSINLPTLNHVYYDENLYSSDNDIFNRNPTTNSLEKFNGNAITKSGTAYNVSLGTPAKRKPANENEIVYHTFIEPKKVVLNTKDGENELRWKMAIQQVDSNGKLTGQKQYVDIGDNKIWNSTGSSKTNPTFQVKIDNDTFSSDSMTDSNQQDEFGFKFKYNPGRYKVKVGFQGFESTVTIDNKEKTIIYRSTENEFIVDIYWVMSNAVNFAQIFKKISEEQEIQSISISTTSKFQSYMNTIRGKTTADLDECMHFFIKNIVLHEANHIPLLHPNVRMKIYSKAADGSDTTDNSVNIRKIGAVIEYK